MPTQRVSGLVSVVIPYLDELEMLSACLKGIAGQTWEKIEVVIVDNGSRHDIEGVCPEFLATRVVRNLRNEGFARAVNQGFALCRGEYLLVLNSDALLKPDYVVRLVETLAARERGAAATGKLLKMSDRQIIDSTGHILWGDRRVQDRGEWQEDSGQFDSEDEIFSIPATAALYRSAALEDVVDATGELFDESFYAYGEDVDLAWRLRLRGWTLHYNPRAVARHRRSISRALGPSRVVAWDLRNRYLRMLKNDHPVSVLKYLGEILLTDLRLFLFYLVRRPAILPLWWWGVLRLMPQALKKRRAIQGTRKVPWRDIEKWFVRYPYANAVKRLAGRAGLRY